MQTTLAVLLYMHILVPGGTYTSDFIQTVSQQQEPNIESIEADPNQMNIVMTEDYPQVESIVIVWPDGH
jgi:hypothetical protein